MSMIYRAFNGEDILVGLSTVDINNKTYLLVITCFPLALSRRGDKLDILLTDSIWKATEIHWDLIGSSFSYCTINKRC